MFSRTQRKRAATLLGLVIVIALAQTLTEHHIEPVSWLGLGIIIPTLLIAALLLSVIMHSGGSQ